MRKILIITGGLFKREELEAKEILAKFDRFKKYDACVDFAEDDTVKQFEGKPQEFILKIEKEGPEWIESSPEIMAKINDAEIVLTHFSGVNSEMINAGKKLKLIGVMRSGVENVNVLAATENGITVCNCPGRVSEPVADFTVALILVEVRNIIRSSLNYTRGEWTSYNKEDKANTVLRNHVVGIIGFGIIGKKVAIRLRPFGVRILAYDPFCSKTAADELGVELVSLEDLLKESDYVTIHARLSEETKNLIGEKEFALMKPNTIFINTARAGLVDEKALIDALRKKTIRSAALDVFSEEPLPKDHPLLSLDNVTLTPHRAGGTIDTLANSVDIMIQQLEKYFTEEPLLSKMN